MPTRPPPELLPFLDALAELLANQILKELRESPEQANAPTNSDASAQMKNGISVAPGSLLPGWERSRKGLRKGPQATKGLPKAYQKATKWLPKG